MNKIILIGGMPRCGKTSLAHFLLSKHDIPFYSTDILCQLLHASFPTSGIDVNLPIEQKIQTFEPVLRMLIKTFSYQKGTFVIEGDVITPALAKELEHVYNSTSCFLGSTNTTPTEYRTRTGGGYDWISERTEQEVKEIVDYVQKYSAHYKELCQQLGLMYSELDTKEFDKEMEILANYLLNSGKTLV